MTETIAPVKKAVYKATIIFGNPKKTPIRNESLMSPKPKPRPDVPRNKSKKNNEAPSEERR